MARPQTPHNFHPSTTMRAFLTSLLVACVSSKALQVEEDPVVGQLKAASPLTNCGCQCSSLTFADSAGVVQGNCKTVDGTGARWCYVDAAYGSSCQDLTPSARFPANPWSYEACATPAIGSYECPTVVATPAVVNVVPVHHPEDHHDDHHPEVPLDCRVPVHGCPGFAPPVVAPSGAGVPVHVFPDNVRAEFPEGEERQNLEVKGDQVRFGEPTK